MGAIRLRLAAALGAAGFVLAACQGGGTPPQRGFGSRLLLNSRDPTLSLIGYAADGTVYYTTGGAAGGEARTFWSIDTVSGRVVNLGPKLPDPAPPDPSVHTLDCSVDSSAGGQTLVITDSVTQAETSIDHVQAISRCPTVDDPFLAAVRLDGTGVARLWSGAFDQLQPAPVDLIVDQLINDDPGAADPAARTVTVLAAPSDAPESRGILRIDTTTFAITPVIPPVLAGAAWASGATPEGSLQSAGLLPDSVRLGVGPHGPFFAYDRRMSDGGDTLFLGPLADGASAELALHRRRVVVDRIAVGTTSGVPAANLLAWRDGPTVAGTGDDQLLLWDTDTSRLTSCTMPATAQIDATLLPDQRHIAMVQTGTADVLVEPTETGPLLLVSRDAADACRLLAGGDVGAVSFSSTQILWVTVPAPYDRTLWVASLDGSNPRQLGTGYLDEPHFLSDTQIELEMGGDLVWLDTVDDPVRLHYVVEQVYGAIWDSARWVITGWDYTAQDGTGTMGLVARDDGQKRSISPAVSTFMLFWTADSSLTVAYLVRGRNPSAQDGLWAATLTLDDLQ